MPKKVSSFNQDRARNFGVPHNFPEEVRRPAECVYTELILAFEIAREFVTTHVSQDQWNDLVGEVENCLSLGETPSDLVNRFFEYAVLGRGKDAHLIVPALAVSFCIAGLKALECEPLNTASEYAERALVKAELINEELLPEGKFKKRAYAGAKGKARRNDKVKEQAKILLVQLMPPDGWTSKKQAFTKVVDELQAHHRLLLEESNLNEDNLDKRLYEWSIKEPDLFPVRLKSKS